MKLSEYLKQNGMTTKEYFEMQERKEDGKTSFSDYQRKLYQEIKSTDLSDIVKDLSSNKFLDQETLSYYNDRVSQVADKVSRFKMGDANSNNSFLENLKTLQSGIAKASEYYSIFKDENDYNAQLKAKEQNEVWKNADTKTLKIELDTLKNDLERARSKQSALDTYKRSGVSGSGTPEEAKFKNELASILKNYGYSSLEEFESAYSEKKQFYNNAVRVQEGIALQNNAINSEDFDTYSKKGADIENPTYKEVTGHIIIPSGTKKIKNKVTYSRDNYDEYENSKLVTRTHVENKNGSRVINGINELYTKMSEEEVAIYNYYLAKEGEEKADEFLNSIADSLNYRQAESDFEDFYRNKPLLEYVLGVSAGVDQWTSGVKSLFNNDGEYVSQSAAQIMSGMAREDLHEDYGIIGQGAYDLVNTTANMLPSILIAKFTGGLLAGAGYVNAAGQLTKGAAAATKLAGAGALGISAAGNGYQEMLNLGYDKSQALAYGTLVGVSEAGLEYVLGGISSLGGTVSDGITDTVVNKLISNLDNAIAKVAIGAGGKLVGSMVSEFSEEYLQDVLDPVFKNITLKTDEDIKLFSAEALYSGILGALSAGLLEGGSTVSGEVATYKAGKDIINTGQVSNLEKLGTSFSADTVAYKIASQLNGKTDAYTIGRLLHEAGADSLSETNMADIAKSLERKGIAPENAQTIAKWLNKAVEGEYFTKSQRLALENPDILQTFKDVIVNQNSTVNQRNQSYTDILQSIATQKETQKANKNKAKSEETKKTPFVPYSNKEILRKQVSGEDINLSVGKSISNTKKNIESKFETNLDGKTVNIKSGEDVTISEIASIENGKMALKLENGETVDANDISFGTKDEALIYSTVLDMGVNAVVANSLVKNYNPSDKLSAEKYALGIKEAYKYGFYGMPISEISKNGFAADLSEPQRIHSYNLGKADANSKVEKAHKEVKKDVSSKGGFEGKVYFNGDALALKEVQRESLKRMCVLSEVLGVNIHVFESYLDNNGKRVYKNTDGNIENAPNGYYKNGEIYIDLNSGLNGQGTMIYTTAHELGHFIKEWSPAKFKVLADFLMEQYGKQGQNVNDLVEAQIDKAERNGRTIDYDTAYEEMVCDSLETMLTDDNVLEKIMLLKSKDEGIIKKIVEFFEKIVDSFRKLMQQHSPETTEGKIVSEMKEEFTELQNLFADALVDASDNYQANKGQKSTASEGDVKFMARDEGDTSVKEQIKANQDLLNSMDVIASMDSSKVFEGKQDAITWSIEQLEKTGFKINRKGFGEILIDKKRIQNGYRYLKTNEEKLAYALIPEILKNGEKIGYHPKHKGREYDTTTFAAPVEINGHRGNMAVVVRQEDRNYYKVHRLLLPDGSQFVLNEKGDTAERAGQENNLDLSPTDNVSENSIPQTSKKSQEKDIRFQDRDSDAADKIEKINNQLAKENVKLIEDVKYLKELLKLQSKETHGKMLKKSTVELVAKRLISDSNAKGNVSELVSHLTDVYSYIVQGEDVSWEGIKEKSKGAVDWLIQHEYHKPVRTEIANEILSHLRTYKISLNPMQKKETANYYGSYHKFHQKSMGRLKITNDGVPLDTFWQELTGLYPAFFDSDVNSNDQPIELMRIIDNLQNNYEMDDYYKDEMYDQWLLEKVYDGYWDVSSLHTVADAKQKEINLLKARHNNKMKEVKQSHLEAVENLKQENKDRISKLRAQYREREETKIKKLTQHYQKSRKEAVEKVKETREKRDAITKLQKLVLDTAKWVSYPAKNDVKCPDIIRAPYAEFLNSIDLSSKRLLNGGEPTQNDLKISSAMDSLAKAIEKKLGAQNPNTETETVIDTGYLDLPVYFVENLKELAEDLKKRMKTDGHIVNSMTSEEIKTFTKLIKTLNHSIKEMSTLYSNMRFAKVEQLGNDTMLFLKDLGEMNQTNSIVNFVTWENALPYYTFKRFGVGGESVFEELMDSQDKLAYLADQIFKFKEKTWTDKEASEWSKDTHIIKLPSGNELTLTSADAMSIYCLSRREQGKQHLLGGGVRVLGVEKNGKKTKDSRSTLNLKDIETIYSSLSKRQKEVAESIQEYMSTVCAEWGNEISMKRFLTKEFTESFYFPIESNDENLDTKDPRAQQNDLYRLLNISATKPLTNGANNEVIIRNVFDVFTNHSSDMAKLNAYGMAVLDYMKWINYRVKTTNYEGQISVSGVRKSMEKAYGTEAKKYVIGLIKDINGRANDGGDHPFLMKLTRAAKTAMVGANLRVSLLQFTAYPRAAMVLSNKSIALGLTKIPKIEKAKKYCGIALWKSFGFYDTNISRSIEDQIKGAKNIRQKIIELSLKGAEWGDAITWGCLWNACEYEVASTKQYRVGSEEFNKAVGKKLREVVYATQVVDSVLTRSQMMRNKSGLTQSASAFMSEPTLSANILMDAGFQFNLEKRRTGSAKLAWKKMGKYIGKAIAVYSISQLFAALVEGIMDAYRDDDDEEFIAKFEEAFKENTISDLNPFNKIPIVSEVSDLILSWFGIGFSSSNSLYLQAIEEANNAFGIWSKVINGEGGKTVYAGIYSTTKLMSYITGVSASGLMREGVTLWNNTAGAADPYLKVSTYESSATDKSIAEYYFDKGDVASVKNTVSKMVDDKVKSGKTEKEAKTAVKASFTSTYKAEYIVAVNARDYDEMNRIRQFLYATGLYGTLPELDETLKKWRTTD